MKNSDELFALMEKHLTSGLNDLWDSLTPKERNVVFQKGLVYEWIGVTY